MTEVVTCSFQEDWMMYLSDYAIIELSSIGSHKTTQETPRKICSKKEHSDSKGSKFSSFNGIFNYESLEGFQFFGSVNEEKKENKKSPQKRKKENKEKVDKQKKTKKPKSTRRNSNPFNLNYGITDLSLKEKKEKVVHQQLPKPNEGDWSADEVDRFLEGFEALGRRWKAISLYYVKTRNQLQVTTFAQKMIRERKIY
eukprot:gene3001-5011_t